MILVTGATGTVGRAVVERLCARGVPVRATTRRPAAAHLPDAAEVVRVDLDEPDTLIPALTGVDRVFAVADGPLIPRHDAALAKAASAAGVAHIVKLSSGRVADETADDPIPRWHREGERAIRESRLAWTMLRPLGFMSNALHWAHSIREHGTVRAPFGQGRIAVVDPADIAAVAVRALTEPGHDGRAYLLSGPEALTPQDQTRILGEVLGRTLRYIETTPADARDALLAAGLSVEMADAVMALRAGALESFTARVVPTVEEITGHPPHTFADWATQHRAEFA
ncbi:NAD(P)H-binding protein [Nocardia sp. NPDC004068]|uniref:NAD(P)H-binding protein n=1 Tax=Nocardia sp. NPDC004068 TaxID=3364303 RepID=UPI0036750116